MIPLEEMSSQFTVKAIIVGEPGVGKTQLLNRWTANSFAEKRDVTTRCDFKYLTINDQGKNVRLQIWDTPGDEQYMQQVSIYSRGSNIVIIVVTATDSQDTKLAKIDAWLQRIKENTDIMPAIVIIENKMDLLGASALADNGPLSTRQHSLHFTVSIKDNHNFNLILLNALKSILPAILFTLNNPVVQFTDNKNNFQLSSVREHYIPITERCRELTETQARMILASLESLLVQGTLNERNKRYSIFSGGKPLILKNGSTITVPKHVYDWVLKIVAASQFTSGHKQLLKQLYDEIHWAAGTKPFSRSATTHDFYANSLLGFIEHSVNKTDVHLGIDYISIRTMINDLPDDQIDIILDELFTRLKRGNSVNPQDKPYEVSFWGGKTHTLSESDSHNNITVPGHVCALLNIQTNPSASKKEMLINALDYAYIAKYSTCSSRILSTFNFYHYLPMDLVTRITQLHANPIVASSSLVNRA